MKKRNINCSYALIGEPTENNVVTSSRGNSVYVIQTIGKACHSMNPENGINALYPMANLIMFIEMLNEKYKGIISLNPILSEGGVMPNQVCGQATMKLSIRASNITLRNQVFEIIKKKLDELSEKYGINSKAFPVFELKPFERRESEINETIISHFNKQEEEYLATIEAGEIQNIGINDITIIGPGNLNLAHKENKYCDISLLLEYSKILPDILSVTVEKIENIKGNVK